MVQADMSKSFTFDSAPLRCDAETLLGVEQRGFNAWPARHSVLCGDWLLRASHGYTKRANSANAHRPGARLDALLPQIEAFYARQGLPAIFRISPLASAAADAQLSRAGYQRADPSLLMRMALADTAAPGHGQGVSLDLEERPGQAWLQGFSQANALPVEHRQVHRHMLESIAWPAAFATLHVHGEAAGFGLAVLERAAVGLYDIVVTPALRGRGLGHLLVQGLSHWGRERGARWAELQVREPNLVARRLYEKRGFEVIYGYHYRLQAAAS